MRNTWNLDLCSKNFRTLNIFNCSSTFYNSKTDEGRPRKLERAFQFKFIISENRC